ncbi:MAG TPA: RNA polymerase sigma factor [Candidatus Sulfotelmatobacter sp.]|nr:RNA polymerase sigma factor [Candidatus Sulfotelmatobacter sp.]
MEREIELALVERLRAGDVTAFDQIFDEFNRRLLSFLTRLARDRSVAEDLVEETWLRLVSVGDSLRPDTSLGAWLFTVARNLYISYCRSRVRESAYTADLVLLWPGDLPPTPFDVASLNEFEGRLEAAIANLPAIYREAILLVAVEQLRPVDAARVCGITPESLRQRLKRARDLITRWMETQDSSAGTVCAEVSDDVR